MFANFDEILQVEVHCGGWGMMVRGVYIECASACLTTLAPQYNLLIFLLSLVYHPILPPYPSRPSQVYIACLGF